MNNDDYFRAADSHLKSNPDISFKPNYIDFGQLEEPTKKQLALNLLLFRKTLQLSQERLSQILNVSRSQYRKYENGDEIIRLDVAQRIALKCGLPLFHLLQNSHYQELLQLPRKNLDFDRILFYANSINDEYFLRLCKILATFIGHDLEEIKYKPANVCPKDFANAINENEKSIYFAIAEGIRACRLHFNYSQENIASLMGVSLATYREYEKGSQRPRFNMLMATRWTVATGIHPFVPLKGTHFLKIRQMQSQRLDVLESILSRCCDNQLQHLIPLVEGFYNSLKQQKHAYLFSL